MTQIIFLTVFLGLTAGVQTISLRATGAVAQIRLELDGRALPTIREPWSTRVDFGKELRPHQLVAIGLDDKGDEVTRAVQYLNLSNPSADVELVVAPSDTGAVVEVHGHHRLNRPVTRTAVTLDGKRVKLDAKNAASLPKLDWTRSHVLAAELRFDDGEIARREVVMHGGFSDAVQTQLTPVLMQMRGRGYAGSLDVCFFIDKKAVAANGIEKPDALVIFVKDPDPMDLLQGMKPRSSTGEAPWQNANPTTALERDTILRTVWPVPETYTAAGETTSIAFPQSSDHRVNEFRSNAQFSELGIFLQQPMRPIPAPSVARAYADAVAVAAMTSTYNAQRRAVVLIASRHRDHSVHSPVTVRRYLEHLGIPLFVWTIEHSLPDAAKEWEPGESIAEEIDLLRLSKQVNDRLERQRIVWLATDPYSALRVQVNPRCGLVPSSTN